MPCFNEKKLISVFSLIVIPVSLIVIPAKAGIPVKKEWKRFPPSRE